MASKQTEELSTLYRGWVAALKANPEMPLDELRHMFEQWSVITGEPGGVDYIETDAGEVPALWAAPKSCAQDRVLLCAHGGGYVAEEGCGSSTYHSMCPFMVIFKNRSAAINGLTLAPSPRGSQVRT
jgi:hypothetical protein